MSERFPDEVLLDAVGALDSYNLSDPSVLPEAVAAMRAVLEGHLAEQERVRTLCPECGPNVWIDEDGCCTVCGQDVAEVPPFAASDGSPR